MLPQGYQKSGGGSLGTVRTNRHWAPGIKLGEQATGQVQSQGDPKNTSVEPPSLGAPCPMMIGTYTIMGLGQILTVFGGQDRVFNRLEGTGLASRHKKWQQAESHLASPTVITGNPHSLGSIAIVTSMPVELAGVFL